MPVLAREPDVFPSDLLEQADPSGASDEAWQVAHTLPRCEKNLARRLLQREIPFFLPQMEQQTRTPRGRRLTAYLPLFPGYLFLRASLEASGDILDTGCVARLLCVPDPDEFEFDLRQIFKLTHCGAPLVREPEIKPGMRVRVVFGPFQGFEGQVLKRHSGDRLLVQINYLQQGISVALDGCEVERI